MAVATRAAPLGPSVMRVIPTDESDESASEGADSYCEEPECIPAGLLVAGGVDGATPVVAVIFFDGGEQPTSGTKWSCRALDASFNLSIFRSNNSFGSNTPVLMPACLS